MMRRRRRRGRFGRPPQPVRISHVSEVKAFLPDPPNDMEPVHLDTAELEAIRLIDLEDLNQHEAGERMGTSRGTIWRLLQSGRRKITLALVEGRGIVIQEIRESI